MGLLENLLPRSRRLGFLAFPLLVRVDDFGVDEDGVVLEFEILLDVAAVGGRVEDFVAASNFFGFVLDSFGFFDFHDGRFLVFVLFFGEFGAVLLPDRFL